MVRSAPSCGRIMSSPVDGVERSSAKGMGASRACDELQRLYREDRAADSCIGYVSFASPLAWSPLTHADQIDIYENWQAAQSGLESPT